MSTYLRERPKQLTYPPPTSGLAQSPSARVRTSCPWYTACSRIQHVSWSPVGVQRRPSSCGTSFCGTMLWRLSPSLGGRCWHFPASRGPFFLISFAYISTWIRVCFADALQNCGSADGGPRERSERWRVATHGVHPCMRISRLPVVRSGCSLLRTSARGFEFALRTRCRTVVQLMVAQESAQNDGCGDAWRLFMLPCSLVLSLSSIIMAPSSCMTK